MNPTEAATALAYANQADKRVETNDAVMDAWEIGLATVTFDEAIWGIKNYAATALSNSGWPTPAITPGVLRKIVLTERDRAASTRRALDPPVRHTSPNSYRSRDPEAWGRLVAQGKEDHLADLQRRGIPLTPEQEQRR